MVSRFLLLALAGPLFSIICTSTTASADPVTVTSGRLTVAWDDPSFFIVSGEAFAVTGLFVPVQFSPQQLCFAGCLPGTTVDFSARFGSPSDSLGVATVATVGGVSYPAIPPNLILAGALIVDAPSIVLPALSGSAQATFSAPFVFHGQLAGFERSAPASPLFALDLAGSGTANLFFSTSTAAYSQPEVVYTFSAPSVVPEPASAVLLLTGIAALVGRRICPSKKRSGIGPPHATNPLEVEVS